MKHSTIPCALLLAVSAGLLHGCDRVESAPPPPLELGPVGATMLEGLGDHSMLITTRHPDAQRWFDQGLALTYGFNHDAAGRSFLRATEVDPECAMCWWGAALVLGPHVNAGMDPAYNRAAWDRLQRAKAAAKDGPARERDYVEALAARYAQDPPENRHALDEAYAAAMGELARRHPDDLDAATLFAEALMNLQPWDYWDEAGNPKGNTAQIVAVLESVIGRNPDHPGALHLYIHAVEASNEPERGVAAADRLRTLMPGAGHLVHMPAHIYARVGRWHDAVIANENAIAADDAYLAACRPQPGVYPLGYVPHNHHFLWFAATMSGQRDTALAVALLHAEGNLADEVALRWAVVASEREAPELAAFYARSLLEVDRVSDESRAAVQRFARRTARWDLLVEATEPWAQAQPQEVEAALDAVQGLLEPMVTDESLRTPERRARIAALLEASERYVRGDRQRFTRWLRLTGDVAWTMGEADAAQAAYEQLVRRDGERRADAVVLYRLGELARERGALRDAQRLYQRALDARPGFREAQQGLERIGG